MGKGGRQRSGPRDREAEQDSLHRGEFDCGQCRRCGGSLRPGPEGKRDSSEGHLTFHPFLQLGVYFQHLLKTLSRLKEKQTRPR